MAMLLERSTNATTLVSSYYILLPSATSTMLIKSIASRDIMMPYDTQGTSNVKSATITEFVDQQMSKVVFIFLILVAKIFFTCILQIVFSTFFHTIVLIMINAYWSTFNLITTNVPIIYKGDSWFNLQIKWLVSIWWEHWLLKC